MIRIAKHYSVKPLFADFSSVGAYGKLLCIFKVEVVFILSHE